MSHSNEGPQSEYVIRPLNPDKTSEIDSAARMIAVDLLGDPEVIDEKREYVGERQDSSKPLRYNLGLFIEDELVGVATTDTLKGGDEHAAFLEYLVIGQTALRNHGWGGRLLREAERLMRESGANSIYASPTLRAKTFFEDNRNAYEEIHDPRSTYEDVMIHRKQLS